MKSKNFLPAVLALGILIGSCAQGDKTGSIGGKFSAPLFVQDKVLDAIPQNLSHFTVNADAGTQIHAADGAMILVPANSFVDKAGNVVKGDVDLNYKSINSHAEIIASGLPMNVNYKGSDESFISDGMFEITASQAGASLELAEGKSLQVYTPGRDLTSEFKYWYFDKEKGNWEEIGTRTELKQGEDIRAEIGRLGIDPNSGITGCNWIWSKPGRHGIFAFASEPPIQVTPNKIIPGSYDKKKAVLDLNFHKESYPELMAYSRIMWQFAGKDPAEDPERNAWIYQGDWEDVQLNPVKDNKNLFELKFSVNQRGFRTIVSPVVSGKDLEKAKQVMAAEIEKYKELQAKADQAAANVATIEANMYNAFSVRRMGSYNCDRFANDPQAVTLHLEGMYEGKALERFKMMYVFTDRKRNVITYYPGSNMKVNPRLVNAIVIVAANGTLAVVGQDQIKAAQERGSSRWKVVFERIAKKINNLSSLDDALSEI